MSLRILVARHVQDVSSGVLIIPDLNVFAERNGPVPVHEGCLACSACFFRSMDIVELQPQRCLVFTSKANHWGNAGVLNGGASGFRPHTHTRLGIRRDSEFEVVQEHRPDHEHHCAAGGPWDVRRVWWSPLCRLCAGCFHGRAPLE